MFGWGRSVSGTGCADDAAPEAAGAGAWGILNGTRVATEFGWRPVEAIAEGDLVLTFDGGALPVVVVERHVIWCKAEAANRDAWPLSVPAGALGNGEEMLLLPDQAVVIESDAAEDMYGDPFVLVAARTLDGVAGIAPVVPPPRLEVVTLRFAREEVVFANFGALFLCRAADDDIMAAVRKRDYPVLGQREAERIARDTAAAPPRAQRSEPLGA